MAVTEKLGAVVLDPCNNSDIIEGKASAAVKSLGFEQASLFMWCNTDVHPESRVEQRTITRTFLNSLIRVQGLPKCTACTPPHREFNHLLTEEVKMG